VARATATVDPLRYEDGTLWVLDQTLLPWREEVLALGSADEVAAAIARLSVRGAPLIGVAAAYGLALELARVPGPETLDQASARLRSARPTAVNLAHAVDRVRDAALAAPAHEQATAALAAARAIHAEEAGASEAMAAHGAKLLASARRVMTHCNTGALAAPGRGTAQAVIAELWQRGGLEMVIANESRPLLQGARLTVWELTRLGIPHQLAVDSAAAGLIAARAVDAVIVGCDRVAANGDVANKVGTYGLSLAAQAAGIPFVVAGPTTTIDPACPDGAGIEIEERSADEVRQAGGAELTLPDVDCRNPAFDVTPARFISALVTERGVASPLTVASVGALLHGSPLEGGRLSET
jgi:methylthioribose-1-phosphate isomerase